MKCAKHSVEDAVGTCSKCGRGLCHPCTERFTLMKCEKCLLEGNAAVRKRLKGDLINPAILGIAVMLIPLISGVYLSWGSINVIKLLKAAPEVIAIGILAMFAPAGWRLLTSVVQRIRGDSDSLFLFGNPLLLAMVSYFYFIFRCFVALALGVVAGPYFIWKATKEIRFIDQTEDSIRKGLI